MTGRREFLGKLGVSAAAAMAFDADELHAASATRSRSDGPWDTSWLDRLAAAKYKVVFNGNEMNDGEVLDYANTFLVHYREVHGTSDKDTRPVIVFRRLGTTLALNDAMWDRYALGEGSKVTDPATHAPARRNIYWPVTQPAEEPSSTIESLHRRGMISLVCNVAVGNVGRRLAGQFKREVAEVQQELRANLVPGAILVPSGIYALIRAQNAGCAWMPGT